MSEQDLAQGLAALADDEVRVKVAAGDLAAAGELELTDEEQELLVAAASDEAEVVGFGINTSLMGGLDPQAWKLQKVAPDVANRPKTADKLYEQMMGYIKG
jgi:hypothetical protein